MNSESISYNDRKKSFCYVKIAKRRLDGHRSNFNNNNNNNNNIYTGGVLTLSGFRNGPVKNIKKKKRKSYIRKYCIILKKYDIKNSKN